MIMNLLDRMKFPFRRNKEFLSALYDILGFYPHNIDIYRLAFAHKSMSGRRQPEAAPSRDRRRRGARPEQPAKPLNNERLEYLGDAVLETVVSDIVFHHFPTRREGFLTATRSKIVQRESLNRLAAEMGLERLIQASQGTHLAHTNIGGNAFEALMGAIYLDRGFKHCYWFIAHRVIGHYIDLDTVADKEVNFKSKLLEWSQKNRINLSFRDQSNGEDAGFRTTVVIEGIQVSKGAARSKKEAHQQAAHEALKRMRSDEKFYDSLFRAKEKRTAMEAQESFALPHIDDIDQALAAKSGRQLPTLEEHAPTPRSSAQQVEAAAAAAYDEAYNNAAHYEVIDEEEDLNLTSFPETAAAAAEATPSKRRRTRHPAKSVGEAVKGIDKGLPAPTETAPAAPADKAKKQPAAHKANKSAAKAEASAEKIEKPTVKAEKPVEKVEKPAEKAEKPVEKDEKPAEKAEKPVEKAEKPAENAEKPVEKAEKPAKPERKPARKQPKVQEAAAPAEPAQAEPAATPVPEVVNAPAAQPEAPATEAPDPVSPAEAAAPRAAAQPVEDMAVVAAQAAAAPEKADETVPERTAPSAEAAPAPEAATPAAAEPDVHEAQPAAVTDEAQPLPHLRHITLDDFVFGMHDAQPTDLEPAEAAQADAEAEAETPAPRKRNPRRRSRKPRTDAAAHDAPAEAEEADNAPAAPAPADSDAEAPTPRKRNARRRSRKPRTDAAAQEAPATPEA